MQIWSKLCVCAASFVTLKDPDGAVMILAQVLKYFNDEHSHTRTSPMLIHNVICKTGPIWSGRLLSWWWVSCEGSTSSHGEINQNAHTYSHTVAIEESRLPRKMRKHTHTHTLKSRQKLLVLEPCVGLHSFCASLGKAASCPSTKHFTKTYFTTRTSKLKWLLKTF